MEKRSFVISQHSTLNDFANQISLSDLMLNNENIKKIKRKAIKYAQYFIGSAFEFAYKEEGYSTNSVVWFSLRGKGKNIGYDKNFSIRVEFKIHKDRTKKDTTSVVPKINSIKVPMKRFEKEYNGGTW